MAPGRGYQFPGNYLKLQLESGEIDFIVAGRRTSDPVQGWEFEGGGSTSTRRGKPRSRRCSIGHRPSRCAMRSIWLRSSTVTAWNFDLI